jgi:uncharacterized membrane protein
MKHKDFLNQVEHDQIVAAIRAAESRTSGEIRVFISRHNPADALAAAQKQFNRLGMARTKHRNGVLLFLAPAARKFAVIGDQGIHQHCGDGFWQQVAGEMADHFRKAEFTNGLVHAIDKAGQLLAQHFPRESGDVNELPDEIEHD